jgi:long-chain acyl-CoA synthetase
MEPQTVPGLLESWVKRTPDAPVMSFKADGKTFTSITYRQLWDRVVGVSAGLHALGHRPGGWLVMIGDGSGAVAPRFWGFALGAYRLGASVAFLGGRRLDELTETVDRCSPAALVCESDKAAGLALQACAELAKSGRPLPRIIRLEEKPAALTPPSPEAPAATRPEVVTFDELLAAGEKALASGEVSREGPGPAKPEDICLMLLTSGSTGKRKAVPLTYANFWHSYMKAMERLGIVQTDCLLHYMPAAHVLGQTLVYGVISKGGKMAFAPADARMIGDIAPSGATVLPGPPRLGQVIMTSAEYEIRRKGRFTEWLYGVAQWGGRLLQGGPPLVNLLGWPMHQVGRSLIYPKVRAKLGRVRLFIFGSAPLPREVQRWLYLIGIPAVNGYGLTEAPVLAVSPPEQYWRLGPIGTPLPGVEFKFRDESGRETDDAGRPLRRGNLCVRGGPVLAGYYQDEAATRESITDGWFATGDLANVNAHGELTIEGRLKDILVPLSGENLAPVPVENAIAACPYVDQVVVVGDSCRSIGALIVPNFERVRDWAKLQNVPAASIEDNAKLAAEPAVRKMLTEQVKALTTGIEALAAHGGAIGRVEVLAEAFSVENGLLTPDIRKIRRRAIYERYDAAIKKLCN